MAHGTNNAKAMELRKRLRERLGELDHRVEKTSCDAFEHILYERMDTYFTQEQRLDELQLLLVQIKAELDQTLDLPGLKHLVGRLTFLEDHFEDINSALYNRPVRHSHSRFNFFRFFRQWQADATKGMGNEISSEADAYRELGIEIQSSLKEVRSAFRRLIKEFHPDRNDGDRSTEPKLRRLIAAYDYLKRRT